MRQDAPDAALSRLFQQALQLKASRVQAAGAAAPFPGSPLVSIGG